MRVAGPFGCRCRSIHPADLGTFVNRDECPLVPTIASFSYDALSRRIQQTESGTTTDFYFSAAGQVLEERVGSAVKIQYIWSPVYVDGLILRDRDSTGSGTLNERLWVVQDPDFNVTALLNNSGSVVERYVYDPYGAVTILSATFTTLSSSAYAWVYLNQGSRFDFVTGLYHHGGYGGRDEDPNLMRWIEEDPLRTGVAPWYGDEGNNPVNGLDPSGLDNGIGLGPDRSPLGGPRQPPAMEPPAPSPPRTFPNPAQAGAPQIRPPDNTLGGRQPPFTFVVVGSVAGQGYDPKEDYKAWKEKARTEVVWSDTHEKDAAGMPTVPTKNPWIEVADRMEAVSAKITHLVLSGHAAGGGLGINCGDGYGVGMDVHGSLNPDPKTIARIKKRLAKDAIITVSACGLPDDWKSAAAQHMADVFQVPVRWCKHCVTGGVGKIGHCEGGWQWSFPKKEG